MLASSVLMERGPCVASWLLYSIAFAPHTHADEQCVPWGGSWKVQRAVLGLNLLGSSGDHVIWREPDLEKSHPHHSLGGAPGLAALPTPGPYQVP